MDIDINKYIEFRPKRDGRERPFIKDTRVEVVHIVSDNEYQGMDAEEIAAGYDHISLAAVYAALSFYHANRQEVHRMMQEDDQIVADFRATSDNNTQHGSPNDARSVSP